VGEETGMLFEPFDWASKLTEGRRSRDDPVEVVSGTIWDTAAYRFAGEGMGTTLGLASGCGVRRLNEDLRAWAGEVLAGM
jgi:hypothetical protein